MHKSSAATSIPVDMYLPNGPDVYVPWGTPLTIHFTESCKPFFDSPDSFETIDGDPLPDGENCCAGTLWGPGLPQDGYQGTDVKVTCAESDPGACDRETFTPIKGGVHVIHIGSSPMSDLLERGHKHINLPGDPSVDVDPDKEDLELDFYEEGTFLCLPWDIGSFEDANGEGLPFGRCFHVGGKWGPAQATTRKVNIPFWVFPGCIGKDQLHELAGSGHVIIVGSGGGIPPLQTLADLFVTDPYTLRSWPETRKVIEAMLKAPKLDSPKVVTDFLVNLTKAGDDLYRVLPGK
jgi:hypothetical protein